MEEQKHHSVEQLKKIEESVAKLGKQIAQERDSVFARFPVIFLLLSSFGLVATFYGFEKVIDQIPFFVERPHTIFFLGIAVLFLSGALYKKLG